VGFSCAAGFGIRSYHFCSCLCCPNQHSIRLWLRRKRLH
jgi:hypothetical protein